MDDFTYGNSPAAVTLAKIQSEKYPRAKKIGKYLCEMNRNLFLLASCHSKFKYDMGTLETMMLLCRNYHVNRIKENTGIPSEVLSYMLNVASTNYKTWLRLVKSYKKSYYNEQRHKSHISV